MLPSFEGHRWRMVRLAWAAIAAQVVFVGGWLVVGGTAPAEALDNLSDVFFRLDCRAADSGCTASQAASSWHGKIHVIVEPLRR